MISNGTMIEFIENTDEGDAVIGIIVDGYYSEDYEEYVYEVIAGTEMHYDVPTVAITEVFKG